MIRYLLRRLGFALLTMALLSMVVFGMIKYAPTDDIQGKDADREHQGSYHQEIIKAKARAATLHDDLPVFYFSFTTADQPDTLYRIFPYSRRERLLHLLEQSGNWPAVQRYETALINADDALRSDTSAQAKTLLPALTDVREARQLRKIATLAAAACQLGRGSTQQTVLDTLEQAAQNLQNDLMPGNLWRPALYWYGAGNQYHQWLSGVLRGDFGESLEFHRPVWETMRFSLLTTLFINGLAFFLAFRISIPLGIAMARRQGRFDRFSRWVLLLLYAMPGFWLGGLLLFLFATPNAGLYLIKGIDLQAYNPVDGPFLLWAGQHADKFILPVLTLSLHVLAIIALQLRGSMREVMGLDFIRTARAKGVTKKNVYQHHAFRNSLLPLIAIFASLFPAIFAGSIIVEYLFNFPGMGMKTYEAYHHKDYPLLFAILMIGSVMTVLGNLLGDILHAWADPRVRFINTSA